MSDDVSCVRCGKYLVIENTNVVVHETKDYILGIVVLLDDEWTLVVPDKPTKQMELMAKEYDYELPLSRRKMVEVLERMQEQMSAVQRRLYDLGDISEAIDEIKEQLDV